MSQASNADHLPTRSILRILLMLLILLGPHLPRLPLWLSGLILGLGVWRAMAAVRTWTMPRAWLRNGLALLTFTAVYVQFGTINGHYAGVALLCAMLALKLTEMNQRRDYLLVVYLSYFLLITHFLFSQDMHMLVLLLIGTIAITMVLIEINHPHQPLPIKTSVNLATRLAVQGLPLMLIFFVLFPRIPGPLWGLPSDAGAGMTGLSDSMEPGMISNLSQSDEVAFRVRFDATAPPRQQLYWRGPVFEYFNGRAWLPGAANEYSRDIEARFDSAPIDYEIQLEPHGQKWLLALDMPVQPWPSDASLGPDLVLRSRHTIADKKLFRLRAVVDYAVDLNLPNFVRRNNLALPGNSNPQSVALARELREAHGDDQALIRALLRRFNRESFSYTLRPPLLRGQHSIDQFMFDTRRGFCEHYASAFTFIARAAGIPARIVTGYQGAEANGDYMIVRQSDAHAWSEVWLAERGWVRIDPTAAVAPERVELGLDAALPAGEPVPGLARMNPDVLIRLRLQWDKVNALWNRWILAYGPELQQQLMSRLGLPGMRALLIALTAGTMLVLIAVGLIISRQHLRRQNQDPVYVLWSRYRRKLRASGLESAAHEGPQDLLQRIAEEKPQWYPAAEPITRLYIRLRYATARPERDPELLKRLKLRIRRFPRPPQAST